MNRLRLNLDLEKSLVPGSLLITGVGNEAEYLGPGNTGEFLAVDNGFPSWRSLPNGRRPFVKSGQLLATSHEDILETDNVWHSGKLTIGDTETNLPFNNLYTVQIKGNESVTGVLKTDKFFSLQGGARAITIAVDPIDGDDTRDFSEYTSVYELAVLTTGVFFKTLDRALDYINQSTASVYFILVRNTSAANPATLTQNRGVQSKYVSIIGSNPSPAFVTLTGLLSSGTGALIQIQGCDVSANRGGNGTFQVSGGRLAILGSSTIRLASFLTNLIYLADGHLYLDSTTFVFGADNQSLLHPAGNYAVTVAFGNHKPIIYTLGSFTGLRLLKAGYENYNVHIRCWAPITFPEGLNIQGGIFQYGETQVQGQLTFDPTNINYKSVLYGATPIRTPNLNSLSADLGGTLKTLVVDDRGVFGVQSQIPVTSLAWGLTGNTGTNPATNFLGTTDNQPLVFRTNNQGRLWITQEGQVGIQTVQPGASLGIGGGVRIGGNEPVNQQGLHLQWNRTGGQGESWILNQRGGGGSTGPSILFGEVSDTNVVTEFARFSKNGYFGIGIDPGYALDVVSGGAGIIAQYTGVGSLGAQLQIHQAGVAIWRMGQPAGQDAFAIYGWSNGVYPERFRIDGAGRVGIGTSAPEQKLHVAGAAVITEDAGTPINLMGRNAAGAIATVQLDSGFYLQNGILFHKFPVNTWNQSTDNQNRFYFGAGAQTYFSAPNGQYQFQNGATGTTFLTISPERMGNTITNIGYSPNQDTYYFIATLPVDNAGNYHQAIINIGFSGWGSDQKQYGKFIASNRAGLRVIPVLYSSGVAPARVQFYQNPDLTVSIYIKVPPGAFHEVSVQIEKASFGIAPAYDLIAQTNTPVGTVIWDSSEQKATTETSQEGFRVNGWLAGSFRRVTTAAYTILPTDITILCEAAGGTITLPSPTAFAGRFLILKNMTGLLGVVTIQTSSGQIQLTSGTVSSFNLPYTSSGCILQSDGSNWIQIYGSN